MPRTESPPLQGVAGDVEALAGAFTRAMAARPDLLYDAMYRFAGKSVRLRIVGRLLADYTRAPFAHLHSGETVVDAPELTINLWDESETGIACPTGLAEHGARRLYPVVGGVLTSSAGGRLLQYEHAESMTWLDRGTRSIIGWRLRAEQLSMWERTRPLPVLLTAWYGDHDIQTVHAGLVARDERGVLFAGANGAGKSTSALACLCAGYDFLSDDHIGLQRLDNGQFVGHSLFCSTHLERDHLARFPALRSHAVASPLRDDTVGGKPLILLSSFVPQRLKRVVLIRALALPAVVDASRSRIRPASKGEALRALAPSTLLRLSLSAGADGLKWLAQLVAQVPCYWLELGRDVESIPRCVDEILALVDQP